MNDWRIKKFLKVIIAVQLAMWGVIGLDAAGLQIPIIRQLIGFIYLAFIPGLIILRILKLHKLGNIETLLYTVGLSIATLMFTGLFMNTIYPLIGISGPISLVPLTITISAVVLILCVLSYIRDRDFSDPSYIDIKNVLSPPVLFLCLIPFLAVFGTYLVNCNQNNILLMFLIFIIALLVILISFDKFIPKNLYALAVFVIAISLLFHQSLLSELIPMGGDIMYEYSLAKMVTANSVWDSTIRSTVNGMLSVVLLLPIFSEICEMPFTWVIKVIYPLLFSMVPLGLYLVFQKQTNDKIAFLSVIFFMSFPVFYTELLVIIRQQIAELFLVLLILLMIDKDMDKMKRSLLLIIFGMSLATSHYGLTYIYMAILTSAWLILVLAEHPGIQQLMNEFYSKFGRFKNETLVDNPIPLKIKDRTLSSTFVLLFVVFAVAWYIYVSGSSAFNAIAYICNHIASSIFTDFLKPESAQGLDIMLSQPKVGLLHEINRVICYTNQIFIVIGIIVLLKNRGMKFEREYVAFSTISLIILFAGVSVPFFASSLNMGRLYHIALIFLAPFFVLGGIMVFRWLNALKRVFFINLLKKRPTGSTSTLSGKNELSLVIIVLILYILFNTGFIWTITGEGTSSALDYSKYPHRFTHVADVNSAGWLLHNAENSRIYITTEYGGAPFAYAETNQETPSQLIFCALAPSTLEEMQEGDYIHLRYGEILGDGIMWKTREGTLSTRHIMPIRNATFAQHGNKIYTGGSVVYKMQKNVVL